MDPAQVQEMLLRGRYAEGLAGARKGQEQNRTQPSSDFFIQFRLLEAEASLFLGEPRPALAILNSLSTTTVLQNMRREVDLARARWKTGDLKGASTLLDAIIAKAGSGPPTPLSLEATVVRGLVYWAAKNPEAAEPLWRQAATQAHEINDPYHEGMALNSLVNIPFQAGRWDQAKLYSDAAQSAFQKAGAPYPRSIALSNLAMCDRQLGDLEEAFRIQSQNLEIKKGGMPLALAATLGDMGSISDARGERAKAIYFYLEALGLASKLNDAELAATQAVNLANIYLKKREWPLAEQYNEIARKKNDSLYVKFNAASIAAGKGDSATAQLQFQELAASVKAPPAVRWQSFQALAHLSLAAQNNKESNHYFQEAIAEIVRARAEIKRSGDSIAFLTEPIEVYREYVQSLIDQDKPDDALAVADSSRALSLASPALPSHAALTFQASARASHAVLLSYWLGPKRSYAWVVTGRETRIFPLPQNSGTILDWVTAYRQEIADPARPNENPKSVGLKLYDALIKPVLPLIPPESEVIVVPDGAIHYLNLETLPMPDGRYWIQDVTLSIAPSLALLGTAPPRRGGGAGLLVVGDADPTGPFQRLVSAPAEIKFVEAHFPAPPPVALIGPDATVDAYHQAHPDRFRLIHFATHAEANSEAPLESAVILSLKDNRYKLYARDIYDPKALLRADLVTVSACQSAGAKSYTGEGLVGFAWAFLQAGARHVVAGLWDVDDGATSQLMDRFYAGLQAGLIPPKALRAAKMEFLDSPAALRAPRYWGAFQVYRRSAR